MKHPSRRHFLKGTLATGLMAGLWTSCQPTGSEPATSGKVSVDRSPLMVDAVNEWFYDPVMIRRIELIEVEKEQKVWFLRAFSQDGAMGLVPVNSRMKVLVPMLEELVMPFFVGKDALEIETLIDDVYRDGRNYKFAGMPFLNCVGHVELAILDLLGKMGGHPVADFFGTMDRYEIPVYYSTFDRENSAEVYIENLQRELEGTNFQAIKLKIGGRMSNNADCIPGRTEKLIPLARKTFGDAMTIYVDSNGSYDVPKAMEVGKLLQDYGVAFFEEPCPWQDYAGTKAVADALDMVVAGGEQDNSLYHFAEMIQNRTVDLIQPDMAYNGGFIRALRVAKMAEQVGMSITPHSPRSGPDASYMLHLAALTPNMGPFQEYKPHNYPEGLFFDSSPKVDGVMTVPRGAGWGIGYDASLFKEGRVIAAVDAPAQ
ncbi:MAG: enolase C-terminal domain-like protein [Bacteroidota bacterium]